jgi:FAD/FMN-containing dehydrogenase
LPEGIETMRALKARFDPNGILNPGRFLAGL